MAKCNTSSISFAAPQGSGCLSALPRGSGSITCLYEGEFLEGFWLLEDDLYFQAAAGELVLAGGE